MVRRAANPYRSKHKYCCLDSDSHSIHGLAQGHQQVPEAVGTASRKGTQWRLMALEWENNASKLRMRCGLGSSSKVEKPLLSSCRFLCSISAYSSFFQSDWAERLTYFSNHKEMLQTWCVLPCTWVYMLVHMYTHSISYTKISCFSPFCLFLLMHPISLFLVLYSSAAPLVTLLFHFSHYVHLALSFIGLSNQPSHHPVTSTLPIPASL